MIDIVDHRIPIKVYYVYVKLYMHAILIIMLVTHIIFISYLDKFIITLFIKDTLNSWNSSKRKLYFFVEDCVPCGVPITL